MYIFRLFSTRSHSLVREMFPAVVAFTDDDAEPEVCIAYVKRPAVEVIVLENQLSTPGETIAWGKVGVLSEAILETHPPSRRIATCRRSAWILTLHWATGLFEFWRERGSFHSPLWAISLIVQSRHGRSSVAQVDQLDGLKALIKLMVYMALMVGIVYTAIAGYDAADEAGYVSHSRNAQVKYPRHGWEVGEYVTCAAASGGSEPILNCEDGFLEEGTTREMSVSFWGKAGDKPTVYKCQRGEDSITCRLPQTSASPTPSQ